MFRKMITMLTVICLLLSATVFLLPSFAAAVEAEEQAVPVAMDGQYSSSNYNEIANLFNTIPSQCTIQLAGNIKGVVKESYVFDDGMTQIPVLSTLEEKLGHNFVNGECSRCGEKEYAIGDVDGNGKIEAPMPDLHFVLLSALKRSMSFSKRRPMWMDQSVYFLPMHV